jgi:endonuclease/exonuclease/phosphatase family metal-dependent hydrolase
MFMKKRLYFLLAWLMPVMLWAQEPVQYYDFEPSMAGMIKKTVPKDEASTVMDVLGPEFVKGIKGMALDLSSDAAVRPVLRIKNGDYPDFSRSESLAFEAWVQTKPGAVMGTPIAGNYNDEKPGEPGWLLGTQENGAWSLMFFDGKSKYEYVPTVKKRINDGKWHQLGFSMNAEKGEVWMYMDGKNVTIYNLDWFKTTKNSFPMVIGGSNAKPDYYGQWNAFNGYVDEARIWNRVVSSQEFSDSYRSLVGGSGTEEVVTPEKLEVLSWNIWHGGHRYGKNVGLQRVIDIIKTADADIVNLVETYGSGEEIADSLGYYFYLISSNLSIMSKYPIKETIKKYKPFNHGGVLLDLGNGRELVYFDTWLDYLPDYAGNVIKGKMTGEQIAKDEAKTREKEIRFILKNIKPYLDNADQVPVIMAGDFNSGSHLDWTKAAKNQHFGYVIPWPVSMEMQKAGFIDSFRETNYDPVKFPGFTWSPQAFRGSDKYGVLDRIDFIYYKGKGLQAVDSQVIDHYGAAFPSDHAAVKTLFVFE